MTPSHKLPGRLRGGLSRIWAWARRKRWATREDAVYAVIGGLIGTAIGWFLVLSR
jgi:uncharacterized membrane protein YfcA